jgi:molecular chaperone GrpE
VLELIPVLDDLDRAIAAARASGQGGALLTGVELVRSGFLDRLRTSGVERFDAEDERFDPTRHEAVSAVETDDPTRVGFIVSVLRPGYAVGGDTIRPAQVIVARSPVQTTGGW